MESWNLVDYQTYLSVRNWLEDNLIDLARRYLLAAGRTTEDRGWTLNECEARQDMVFVTLERYAGCGDYDYETVSLPLDYVLGGNEEQESILAEVSREAAAERKRLAAEKEQKEAAERALRLELQGARDKREYERLKEKFGR